MNNCICITSNKEDVFNHSHLFKEQWKERIELIKKSFNGFMNSKKWFKKKTIFTTWSDWRLENKFHSWKKSNMELSVIEDPTIESTTNSRTSEELIEIVKENISFLLDNFESKVVWKDSLTLFNNNSILVFPTRIWDSIPIWWNMEIYQNLRQLVSIEIIENPKMTSYFSKRLWTHKRALKSWKSYFKDHTATLYDLDKKTIFYDPDNMNEGVKYWPLRVIQYSLALALMRKIKNIWSHPDFVDILPTNIIERLDFILDSNITKMSKNEIEDLKYIYSYFLKIYHDLLYSYSSLKSTKYNISKDDAKDMKEMLTYLSESFVIEKIFKI